MDRGGFIYEGRDRGDYQCETMPGIDSLLGRIPFDIKFDIKVVSINSGTDLSSVCEPWADQERRRRLVHGSVRVKDRLVSLDAASCSCSRIQLSFSRTEYTLKLTELRESHGNSGSLGKFLSFKFSSYSIMK